MRVKLTVEERRKRRRRFRRGKRRRGRRSYVWSFTVIAPVNTSTKEIAGKTRTAGGAILLRMGSIR